MLAQSHLPPAHYAMARTKQTARTLPQSRGVTFKGVPIQINFANGDAVNFDDAMVLYEACFSFECEMDDLVFNNNKTIPSPLIVDISNVATAGRLVCTAEQLKVYYGYYQSEHGVSTYTNLARHDLLVVAWCVDDLVLLEELDDFINTHPFIHLYARTFYQEKDNELWQHVRRIIKQAHPIVVLKINTTNIEISNPCLNELSNSNLLMDELLVNNKLKELVITGATAEAVKVWVYYRKDKSYDTLPEDWINITKGAIAMRDEHFLSELLPSLLCKTPQPLELSADDKKKIEAMPEEVKETIMRCTVLRAPKKAKISSSSSSAADSSPLPLPQQLFLEEIEANGMRGILCSSYPSQPDCMVVVDGGAQFLCTLATLKSRNIDIRTQASGGDSKGPWLLPLDNADTVITSTDVYDYLRYIHSSLVLSYARLTTSFDAVFRVAFQVKDQAFLRGVVPKFVTDELYGQRQVKDLLSIKHLKQTVASGMSILQMLQKMMVRNCASDYMLFPLEHKIEQLEKSVKELCQAHSRGDETAMFLGLGGLVNAIEMP